MEMIAFAIVGCIVVILFNISFSLMIKNITKSNYNNLIFLMASILTIAFYWLIKFIFNNEIINIKELLGIICILIIIYPFNYYILNGKKNKK